MVCVFEGRQTGSTVWQQVPANFKAGSGYEFRVTGTDYEGAATMTFEMKSKGRKTQVTIVNTRNYFVSWKGQAQIRFEPNTNQNDARCKIYYDISPPDAALVWDDAMNRDKFTAVPGSDGGGKFIKFQWPSGKSNFEPCGTETSFYSSKTAEQIKLPVFIYYEKLDLAWTQGAVIPANTKYTKYDDVNYSITVADGESITINMNVPGNKPYSGIKITGPNFGINLKPNSNTANLGIQCSSDTLTSFKVSWPRTSENTIKNTVGDTPISMTYVGLLEIEYQYYNGNYEVAVFKRNMLVYAAQYSRKQ
jgi:hypothetical protein